jgi:RNA polymerase sigma-54 factor
MALSQQITHKQLQKLIMTQDLRQSIELLPLSNQELLERIQNEIIENPFLEETSSPETENPKSGTIENHMEPEVQSGLEGNRDFQESRKSQESESGENFLHTDSSISSEFQADSSDSKHLFIQNGLTRAETLSEHLLWQLHLSDLNEKEMEAGEFLISAIDNHGFLNGDPAQLTEGTGISLSDALSALSQIYNFDPVGCGARDIGETLIIQTKILNPGNPPVEKVLNILENHLIDLEKLDYKKIEKETDLTSSEISSCIQFIKTLEPYPGTTYAPSRSNYIIPDLIVEENDGKTEIFVNDEWIPGIKINEEYLKIAADKKSVKTEADREYFQTRLNSANWLLKSIEQRRITMYKVMRAIADIQESFFLHGPNFIKGLTLKEIAEIIQMHESTVSRITTNKYVQTKWGIFELKYFFSSSLKSSTGGDNHSATAIKDRIKVLVDSEDPQNPLSDTDLVNILVKEGVDIARRTVAKYRNTLKIQPADQRKKIKKIR